MSYSWTKRTKKFTFIFLITANILIILEWMNKNIISYRNTLKMKVWE